MYVRGYYNSQHNLVIYGVILNFSIMKIENQSPTKLDLYTPLTTCDVTIHHNY